MSTGNEPQPNFSSEGESDFGLIDLVVAMAEHIKLLIGVPLLCAAVAWAMVASKPSIYTARTTLLPLQGDESLVAAAQLVAAAPGLVDAASRMIKGPTERYASLMLSRTTADRLIEKHGLQQAYGGVNLDEARARLWQNTRIRSDRKDGFILVEVDDQNPTLAAAVANGYVDELRAFATELSLDEARHRRLFFERELERTSGQLLDAQQALLALGGRHGREQVSGGGGAAKATAVAEGGAAVVAQTANMQMVDGEYLKQYRQFKELESRFDLFVRQLELAKLDEQRKAVPIRVIDSAIPPHREKATSKVATVVLAALVPAAALVVLLGVAAAWRRLAAAGGVVHQAKMARLRAMFSRQ